MSTRKPCASTSARASSTPRNELAAAGLNLAGVKQVMALEDELASLRAELEAAHMEARRVIEKVHRQYRRDLVPLNQSPVPYRPPRRS